MQSGDAEYLNRVAEAVVAQTRVNVSSPLSPQRRSEMVQMLLDVRSHPKATLYALMLMRPTQMTDVRFFGCNLLAEQIEARWRSDGGTSSPHHEPYSSHQKADLCRMMFGMFQSMDASALEGEPLHLKEKMASVMASIVIRHWPNPDASLLLSVLHLADMSHQHLLITCLVLRHVAEILMANDSSSASAPTQNPSHTSLSSPSISASHRVDVGNALTQFATETPCFSTIYNFLETLYAQSQSTAATDAGSQQPTLLIYSILHTLQSLAELVPLSLFFSPTAEGQHSFANVAVLLLSHHHNSIQQAAADFLVVLYSRALTASAADKTAALFLFDHVRTLNAFASSCVATVEASRASGDARLWSSSYTLLKRIVQLLVLLGLVELDAPAHDLKDAYLAYLQLMLDVSCFGSAQVMELLVAFWRRLFASDRTYQSFPDAYRTAAQTFLRNSRLLFLNWPYEDWSPEISAIADAQLVQMRAYQLLDFEDKQEWQRSFGTLRADMLTIFRGIGARTPSLTVEAAVGLLQLKTSVPASIGAVLLDGAARIFKSLNSGNTPFQGIEQDMIGVMRLLFQAPPRSGAEAVELMACIKYCSNFYKIQPEWMEKAVLTALQATTLAFPGDPTERDSRRQSCATFSHLANRLAQQLLPHLDSIVNIARPLMSDGRILSQDRMMVLEGLASIASAAPASVASGLLSDLLADPLQQFQSEPLKAMCSSLSTFCDFCGITARMRRDSEGVARGKNNMHHLQVILQTITIIWKKTQKNDLDEPHPLSIHDADVLSTTCMLMRCLNSLLDPSVQKELQNSYSADFLFDADDLLVRAWLRRESSHREFTLEQEIRGWVWTMRDTCLMLCAAIASHLHPFFTPNLISLYHDSLWSGLENINFLHAMQLLNKAVIPVLKTSSFAVSKSVLTADTASNIAVGADILLQKLGDKLNTAWRSSEATTWSIKASYLDADNLAVVQERAMRMASLEYAHLIDSLVFWAPPNVPNTDPGTLTPLIRLLLSSNKANFVFEAAAMCLSWKDTSTLNSILTTLTKFVGIVASVSSDQRDGIITSFPFDKSLVEFVSKQVLVSLVQTIRICIETGMPSASSALNLIRDIWMLGSALPPKIFATLEFSSAGDVTALQHQLSKIKTKSAARNIFKSFFKSVLKLDVDAAEKVKNVLDVKQFSKVLAATKMSVDMHGNEDNELFQLFPLFD
eukprot:TRINITY_DN4809_c0_g2_i1.p1 TRINITY_DN4809_c0_g2~~TRINITY_DN4809_c0_g2_i1.p1  ORF type:complete len:1198 (+),score=205.96 TRINITY_DN4809_c0_g2_i1:21-3614(+)